MTFEEVNEALGLTFEEVNEALERVGEVTKAQIEPQMFNMHTVGEPVCGTPGCLMGVAKTVAGEFYRFQLGRYQVFNKPGNAMTYQEWCWLFSGMWRRHNDPVFHGSRVLRFVEKRRALGRSLTAEEMVDIESMVG